MTDQAVYQLSELLRKLSDTFDETYADQLSRAYRKLEEERQKLFHERCMLDAQQWLPFGDELDDEF